MSGQTLAERLGIGGDWTDSDGKPFHLDDLVAKGLLVQKENGYFTSADGAIGVYTQAGVMGAYHRAYYGWRSHVRNLKTARVPVKH